MSAAKRHTSGRGSDSARCHPVTPSPRHPVTPSPGHPLTPSPARPVTRSPRHPVTPSQPPFASGPTADPLLFLALISLLGGCGPAHIDPYVPKHREYAAPLTSTGPGQAQSAGSLWKDDSRAALLFTDARAFREQDLVVVRVEEIADAHRSSDTDLSRTSDVSATLSAFLKAAAITTPQLDVTAKAGSGLRFDAQGKTARTERMTATVPAIVRKVMPNGNLFIEGHRVILVNQEEQHFYISGLIRPIDIAGDNSVRSASIADAEIEFTGRGVMTENQRPGALTRFFSWLWPF